MIIPELSVGRSRADLAVITPTEFHGIELKTTKDNLNRLPTQVKDYRVFDQATLITSKKHLQKALEIIPDWWGVKTAENLETIRETKPNPKTNITLILSLLWREEMLKELTKVNKVYGVKSKNKRIIRQRMRQVFTEEELRSILRETLANRTDWRVLKNFNYNTFTLSNLKQAKFETV